MIAIIGGIGSIGMATGLRSDLVARLTGGRVSIGAMRVRNYRANTWLADARCLPTRCMPRHELHHAPVAMIRHHCAPNAACAATWAFSPSELGRDL